MDREKIIAIIPARSGSKGIVNKNIKLLCGHPLLYYQIHASRAVKGIDLVVVSTDSPEYAAIARQLGAEVCMRPQELSGDRSKSEEALLHTLACYEEKGSQFDIVVFLQATSPFNKPEYIQGCLDLITKGHDSAVCVVEDYGYFIDDSDIYTRPMRQDRKKRLRETGNCWVVKTDALKKSGNRLSGSIGYFLVPAIAGIDIDEPEDLVIAEALLRQEVNCKEEKYYKRRVMPPASFEETYWQEAVDPDGNTRRLLEEKDKKIEDCKNEISFINALPPGKILDVGCGPGFLLSAVRQGWEKHGVEVSHLAASVAQQYATIHNGFLKDAHYSSEYFDVVVAYHVIEHMQDPVFELTRMHSLLKTHGKLIVATPNFDSGCARRFKENYRLLHDTTHISLFSDSSLKELLQDLGFQVDAIDYPFFETRHFSHENLERLFDTTKISPPFYGNIMTMYCTKK